MMNPQGGNATESLPAYFERKTSELTAVELREYEALAYEIEMLGEVTRLLASMTNAPQGLKNVLVESFAVHYRNLASFLWPPSQPKKKKKRGTDVLAHHFAERWAPTDPRPDDLIDRVSVEVSHLTTRRLSGKHSKKEWRPLACVEALLPTLEAFVSQADAERLSPKVSAELTQLRSVVDVPLTKTVLESINLTTTTTRPLRLYE